MEATLLHLDTEASAKAHQLIVRAKCGCTVDRADRYNPMALTYCPTHAAAPALLEALRDLESRISNSQIPARLTPVALINAITEAREAVRQAEGN